jgi:MFS family permease
MLSQQIRTSAAGSGSLLDSIDAVRNWRAVVLLLATFVAAVLVMAVGASMVRVSAFFPLLFTLLAFGVGFYGVNAAGMMMMDEASGHPSRPIGAAVMSSLATSHRLILVLLMIAAIYLGGVLAFAVLLFVCKIPGIGPLLYTIAFPVGVVVSGIAIFAVPTVVFPLSAPAIWNGATTMAGVSQLLAVARKRLLLVLMLMFAVGLIAGVTGGLIGIILVGGTSFTGILSTAVLGIDAGGSSLTAGLMGGLLGGGSDFGSDIGSGLTGYATAALLGGGIVYAAAVTLPGLVYLRGASAVYLRAIEGLDLAAEQEALRETVAAAQIRAKEFQAQAQVTAQQYAQRAQAPRPGAPVASVAAAAAAPMAANIVSAPGCPACGGALVPGDAFCANCGHKLA